MSKCTFNGCKKYAAFNFEGQKPSLYCGIHKKDGMINVKSKRCLEVGCKKHPYCNFEDKKIGLYCGEHKKDGMVNVISKRCLELGCKKQPIFNIEGEKGGLYCGVHKKDGMVNVKDKKCLELGCKKQPTFNIEGEKRGLYCVKHKKDGMVNVKDRRCLETRCNSIPSYNYIGEKKGIYCNIHKLQNMVDVVHKRCIQCNLFITPTRPYLCSYCKPVTSRRIKTKENTVKELLEEHKYDFIYDKSTGVCGNFRPDFLIDCITHYIVIECDEDQHSQYDKDCENTRMVNIQQSLGLYTVFIRYNPDTYKENNKTVRVSQKIRLNHLKDRIEYYKKTPLDKTMTIEYLYYNKV